MFWTIFLFLFFSMVIYLLLVPIILYINTATEQYYIRLWGLAKASVLSDEKELLRIRLNILFFNFDFYPLQNIGSGKKKKTVEKTVKKKVPKKGKRIGMRTAVRLLKSFKVKRFLLDIDTGNCISNAKLFPAFVFLNQGVGGFLINFQGRNQLVLHLENRPVLILRSFINF